ILFVTVGVARGMCRLRLPSGKVVAESGSSVQALRQPSVVGEVFGLAALDRSIEPFADGLAWPRR
ncbi:MAG: hypothetical protein ACRECE_01625, partial [Xanthobacteraceae bacterium]